MDMNCPYLSAFPREIKTSRAAGTKNFDYGVKDIMIVKNHSMTLSVVVFLSIPIDLIFFGIFFYNVRRRHPKFK